MEMNTTLNVMDKAVGVVRHMMLRSAVRRTVSQPKALDLTTCLTMPPLSPTGTSTVDRNCGHINSGSSLPVLSCVGVCVKKIISKDITGVMSRFGRSFVVNWKKAWIKSAEVTPAVM